MHYVLDSAHNVAEEPDLMKWAHWFEKADRHVGLTLVGDVKVSTVFLGLDHNWGKQGPPIVFETMIFGGKHDQYQERYCTWDEALAGHKQALALVKEAA
jgi:hypothetical protein